MLVTKELINKGIDPSEFKYRGGVNFKTYNDLDSRWQKQQQKVEKHKKDVLSKYGSLQSAPLSLSPFEKISPVTGTKNALVLLTEFKDVKHLHQPSAFNDFLFSRGTNQSLRDYYLEASWNQLDITGQTSDQWYQASDNRIEYVDDALNIKYPLSRKLVKETLRGAKNSGFNFKPFAVNGKIELLIIVYAGYGLDKKHNVKKYIRPHRGRLEEPLKLHRGVSALDYILIPERPLNLGCYCHELGHLLGLPDLYNEYTSPMVGSWCLMACGDHIDDGKTPSHPGAWCKVHLGWKTPKVIKEIPQAMEIPAVIDPDGEIYKIEVPGDKGEYFLLENREKKGFDRNLPGSGLLIWHVDETRCIHKNPNSDPQHPGILLEQSDGKDELQSDWSTSRNKEIKRDVRKDMMGDEGDAYPGKTFNRSFDENSNPNSSTFNGSKTGISITHISDPDDKMQATIGVEGKIPLKTSRWKDRPAQKAQGNIEKLWLLMSPKDKEKPYDQGVYHAHKDYILELMKKEGLNIYIQGYKAGYHHGQDVFKKHYQEMKISRETPRDKKENETSPAKKINNKGRVKE